MKRKFLGLLFALVIIFTLVACDNSDKLNNNGDNEIEDEDIETPNSNEKDEDIEEDDEIEVPEDEEEKGEAEDNNTESEEKEAEATLYFANKESVVTGNEDLEQLISETRTITYENITLSQAIVEALMKGPESDELETVIPEAIKLIGVEESDNTAFVNFSSDNLSGGSMQEDFTLMQIINSLLELDEIQKVQFLVDGEKAETLMGHIIIEEPFTDSIK